MVKKKRKSKKKRKTIKKAPIYKTTILGQSEVGKTQIKRRYLGQVFSDTYEVTATSELSVKQLDKGALQIWDLSGNPPNKRTINKYLKRTEGALLVFDLSKPKSIEKLKLMTEELLNQKGETHIPCVLVGNKTDLYKKTSRSKIRESAQSYSKELSEYSRYKVPYIETSALTGLNIDHIFDHLIDEIKKNRA